MEIWTFSHAHYTHTALLGAQIPLGLIEGVSTLGSPVAIKGVPGHSCNQGRSKGNPSGPLV